MNTELFGVAFIFLLSCLLAFPLGKYISAVVSGRRTLLDFMKPVEKMIFRFCGIDPTVEMNWKQHLKALLTINLLWFVYAFLLLLTQGHLWLNPDGNPSQSPDLAFNTAISFLVNCNLQHYSGETGLTYFTQLFVVSFLQFVTAASGMAALFVLFKALREKLTNQLGNFWDLFVKSITRVLLPLSLIVAIILVFCGTPASFDGKDTIVTLQGDTVQVSRGPAAGMIGIKQIGTNGGGWFGVNSAHPLENPSYVSNIVGNIAILLVPMALVFAFGFYLQRRKLSYVIFGIMTIGFLLLLAVSINAEVNGNPALKQLGVTQPTGSLEGKELRFGPAASAMWGISTTATSNGSVNSMHDSQMPLSQAMQMLDMMINSFYGGVGVGLLNFFLFLVIAVFIAGLMVGRTPEFLGRKIEAREMKIASLMALLHPLLILAGTAFASYLLVNHTHAGWVVNPEAWLNNPGTHGFSEMLYEYSSSAANNGSGLEGLADNNIFWNYSTGIVLLLSRFLPIIGPVAIAGLLAQKKYTPESLGTLRSDSYSFAIMVFLVIVIVAALSFFPALTLGPLAEYFSLPK